MGGGENSDAAGSEPKELESPQRALGTGKNKSNNDHAAPEALSNLDSRRSAQILHESIDGSHAEGADSCQTSGGKEKKVKQKASAANKNDEGSSQRSSDDEGSSQESGSELVAPQPSDGSHSLLSSANGG